MSDELLNVQSEEVKTAVFQDIFVTDKATRIINGVREIPSSPVEAKPKLHTTHQAAAIGFSK